MVQILNLKQSKSDDRRRKLKMQMKEALEKANLIESKISQVSSLKRRSSVTYD